VDSTAVRDSFEELRRNIVAVDNNIRAVLPLIAGRLQRAGCGNGYGYDSDALTALKRELRNWDITRQQWIEPR
jgi:hypothetical protein